MAVSTALSSSREVVVGTWLRSQFSENFMVSPWWARRRRLGLFDAFCVVEQPGRARFYAAGIRRIV
jgi:hypothetical protein